MLELIKFGAEWCGPCKKVEPVLQQFIEANLCKVTIYDVDEHPEMAEKYHIQSIPAFVWLKDGVEVEKQFGVVSLGTLTSTFDEFSKDTQ